MSAGGKVASLKGAVRLLEAAAERGGESYLDEQRIRMAVVSALTVLSVDRRSVVLDAVRKVVVS